MNLYDFSQQNNEEMGILVTRQDDPELFSAIYEDARRIVRIADTLSLAEMEISESLWHEARARAGLTAIGEEREMAFDAAGDLAPLSPAQGG